MIHTFFKKIIRFITVMAVFVALYDSVNAQYNGSQHYFDTDIHNHIGMQWNNVSMISFYPAISFTDVSVGYKTTEAGKYHIVQTGNLDNQFRFNANSQFRRGESVYFGNAIYNNGTQHNVRWNSVNDYNRVAPYVVADTIGGNFKYEVYTFGGGFAKRYNKITFGLKGEYTAKINYRTTDPRPKNTVSDLNMSAGISAIINKRYIVGIYVDYNSYDQDCSLSNYRESNENAIIYMRGFGLSEMSFSYTDSYSNNKYRINKGNVGVNIYPVKDRGFVFNTSFTSNNLNLENNYAFRTFAELSTTTFRSELGYKMPKSSVRLSSEYKTGTGKEFIYLGVDLISKQNMLTNSSLFADLSYQYIKRGSKLDYHITTTVAYSNESSEFKDPVAESNITSISGEIQSGVIKRFKKSALVAKLKLRYKSVTDSDLITTKQAVKTANSTMVIPNFNYLSADMFVSSLSIRYDYNIKNSINLFVKADLYAESFKSVRSNRGLIFTIGCSL
jgi:hypothetical protein